MNKELFLNEVKKLSDEFNGRLNETKIENWWAELNSVQDSVFKQAVRDLIRTAEKMPSLAKVIEVCNALTPESKTEYHECPKCSGCGLVSIEKKYKAGEDKYYYATYAYRCDCKNGERYPNFKPAPFITSNTGSSEIVDAKDWVDTSIENISNKKNIRIGGQNAKF